MIPKKPAKKRAYFEIIDLYGEIGGGAICEHRNTYGAEEIPLRAPSVICGCGELSKHMDMRLVDW